MRYVINDSWRSEFTAGEMGYYLFTVCGWVDKMQTWLKDLRKKYDAGLEDARVDLLIGAGLLDGLSRAQEVPEEDRERITRLAAKLKSQDYQVRR
jgi:starch synthase (maltosyl-transferring)